MRRLPLAALAVALSALPAAAQQPVPPEKLPPLKADASAEKKDPTRVEMLDGMPILFRTDFEDPADLARFEPTDRKAWKVVEQGGNKVYALTVRKSDYEPPVRSPHNISLVKDLDLAGAGIDVRCQSAMTDYGHRSLCVFFNYVDPSHFYYVHFGKSTDPHANQIFIVNGEPRKAITEEADEDGTPWTDGWHHVRVIRNPLTGKIAVYFDDMSAPVMTATDKTFTSGRVGIGSFDDAGNFDRLTVYGDTAAVPEGRK